MSQISPRHKQLSPILAYTLQGFSLVLDNRAVEDEELPTLMRMWEETRLAYLLAERIELDCEAAIKSLRMGHRAAARDRYILKRERDVDDVVRDLLAEIANRPQRFISAPDDCLIVPTVGQVSELTPQHFAERYLVAR